VERADFMMIVAGDPPDFRTISEFRRRHLKALSGLFVQVLRLAAQAGLVKLGHVALDGTKVKANASKHKAMSHKRMLEEEKRLQEKIDGLLKAAESTDVAEDAVHGRGARGDELPTELGRAEARRDRIREAREALEREARERHDEKTSESEANKSGPSDSDEMPTNRPSVDKTGNPTDKAQRNFTDPESRIMKTGDGFIQGYNGQVIVDEAHQIIIAHGLSNQSPDAEYFAPMLDRALANVGSTPAVVTADNGYYSEANIGAALARDIAPLIAPGRERHGATAFPPADDENKTMRQVMRGCFDELGGLALYRKRKTIVEPVFGQIKNRGFRALLLRGLEKARHEWAFIALSHNVLKLHRAWCSTPT
jgi:hypothetical protein